MNYKDIESYIKDIYGLRLNRKILGIESDAWGSIRMPSKEVYKKFLKFGNSVY